MTALWILFSSFCSACILASIQCLRETLAFIDVAFVQFMFVLAVTVVVMIVRKVPFTTHVWHLHLLRSVIGVGVVITTLQYTSPLFVAGFSAIASFRNGEHIDWRILAAIVSAFVGILVMFHPSERSFPAVYVPIGLLCGLFTAAAILMLKKLGGVNEPIPRTVFYFHLHGAVVLGVLEIFCGHRLPTATNASGFDADFSDLRTICPGVGLGQRQHISRCRFHVFRRGFCRLY